MQCFDGQAPYNTGADGSYSYVARKLNLKQKN